MADEAGAGAAPAFPQNMAGLVALIKQEWAALLETLARASEAQMIVPDAGGCSIKDNLVHISTWEHYMVVSLLQGRPRAEGLGIDEAVLETLDENGINAIIYRRNQHRTIVDVLDGLHDTHERMTTALAEKPFDELMAPTGPGADSQPLVVWVANNTYEHYREHRATIEKILA